MDYKFRNKKGITLIALVITVIILLILAGIALATLSGSGILNRAGQAKTETAKAQTEEKLKLALTNLSADYYVAGETGSFRDYIYNNETKLKQELGNEEIVLNKTQNTILYKENLYIIDEKGNITKQDGIVLNSSKITLGIIAGEENEQATLTAKLIDISGNVEWTASPEGIVELTKNGTTATIKAQAAGTVTIKASCSGKTATCEVTVRNVTKATSLSLPSTATVKEGETVEITATQGGDGTEEIEWTTSDPSKATVEGTGENGAIGKVTGISGGIGKETVEITATTKNTKISKKCTVKIIDYGYVEYGVEYTDVYTETPYTTENGWRILNRKDNGNGTYDLDIISTGIPAGVYYYYSLIKSAAWAGTDEDVSKYVANYYDLNDDVTVTKYNIYAVSGLRYHFDKIKYKKVVSYNGGSSAGLNNGYYISISKNGEEYKTEEIGGEGEENPFIARAGATVRSVMHSDIIAYPKSSSNPSITTSTDKGPGLFKLQDYTPDVHNTGYYWLASPNPSDGNDVRNVGCSGSVNRNSNGCYGVRPVVSITGAKMEKRNGVWRITN